MHRIFLGLAITSTSLLVASFGLGLEAAGEIRGASHTWRDVHFLIGLLTVLTGIEVAIAKATTGNTKIVGLIGLAVSKAALVALFYMHLKSETRSLKTIIAVPLAFPFLYALVLIAESIARSAFT